MVKALVFDTGPLISLALNNLLWVLRPLKEKFGGEFYITPSVKKEVVEKPLTTKRYKFEALQVLSLVETGVLKVYDSPDLRKEALSLLDSANSLFMADGNYVKNVQYAEIESVMAAKLLHADAVVVDEFITRALLENPEAVEQRMEKRFHRNIDADKKNIDAFSRRVSGINVIRSFELIAVAYEKGLFREYYLKLDNPKETLLDGLLWGLKLNGCSVTEQEIAEIKKLEGF